MATQQELEIKFKVDASGVKTGSDEAKRQVRSATSEMERDARSASTNIQGAVKGVTNETDRLAGAARETGSAFRNLDRSVATSASNMERNLAKVSRQMSAMQMFSLGSRGIQMLGGAASNILRLSNNAEGAATIDSAVNVGSQSMQGAAIGYAAAIGLGVGGPWGAAIGALVGAGNALLEAAEKQKEAAEKQLGEYEKTANQIDTANQERLRQRSIQDMANMPDTQFDYKTAENQIQAARERYETAQSNLNASLDMAYGRNGYRTALDLQKTVTAFMKGVRNGAPYPWSEGFSDTIARFYSFGPGTYDLGVINWFGKGGLLEALSNRQNIDYALDALDIKDLEDFTPIEKGEDWDKVFPRGTLGATGGFFKWFGDMLSANIVNAQKELDEATKEYQMYAPLEARLAKFNADSEARMRAPLPFDEDDWPEYYGGDPTRGDFEMDWNVPDKAAAQRMKDTVAVLTGALNGLLSTKPTDALTKIGGGRGYAAYNDSTARIQKNIENNLKTLIANERSQNEQIITALQRLSFDNSSEFN